MVIPGQQPQGNDTRGTRPSGRSKLRTQECERTTTDPSTLLRPEGRAPSAIATRRRERGVLNTDMIVALAIFVTAMLPLGYGWIQEQKVLRSHYWHAVAMEIVDGEMEILVAGEWRAFPEGTREYPVKAGAAKNLPPGKFTLTRTGQTLRLEWLPERGGSGGKVVREALAK